MQRFRVRFINSLLQRPSYDSLVLGLVVRQALFADILRGLFLWRFLDPRLLQRLHFESNDKL